MRLRIFRFYIFKLLGLISVLVASITSHASAQDTRAEEIARAKAEKAKQLKHYVPNKGELIAARVAKALSGPPEGFYPYFGSIYTGGLLAAGPGYRRSFGDTGAFDIRGAWSLENYRMVDFSLKLPDMYYGKLSTTFYSRYINASKISFYGLGNDSSEDNKTRFEYNPTSFGVTASYDPFRYVTLGGTLEYLKVDSRGPIGLEEETQGSRTDPVYTVPGVFASFDWRQSKAYTSTGGLYRAVWRDYDQHGDNDPNSFHWFEAEVNQFIPFLRSNQIIALQAMTTITDADEGSVVPFYMMPRLGGSHYLRGFGSSRFRDSNRLLLAAEYRWSASKFLDMALFFEAGKVASRTADLDLNDLHTDVGIGLRFHSPNATVLRIELAASEEDFRFIFTVGPAF